MKIGPKKMKFYGLVFLALIVMMCVPPEGNPKAGDAGIQAKLDSIRNLRCPRLMSSAAEYYRNQDWKNTVRIYRELVGLGCDNYDPKFAPPEEIYLYYAIAYEFLGRFDSAEYVLHSGLKLLPNDTDLLKRLAYSYKRQGKLDDEIIERERIVDLSKDDTENMMELVRAYGTKKNCDRQIDLLKRVLKIDENNEIAKGELVVAYEKCGRDILEVYEERCRTNPNNISYCIDYADKLILADRPAEAVNVLKEVIRIDKNSKIGYKKIARAYEMKDDLVNASKSYEELLRIDPRDVSIAIKVSELNTELRDFEKAMRWADKAITMSGKSGAAYGQKGNVYYKAFSSCRTTNLTNDDRIVAYMAYQYFQLAAQNNVTKFARSIQWLETNDVLFNKANWFMLDSETKNRGWIKPESDCYKWITEKMTKEVSW